MIRKACSRLVVLGLSCALGCSQSGQPAQVTATTIGTTTQFAGGTGSVAGKPASVGAGGAGGTPVSASTGGAGRVSPPSVVAGGTPANPPVGGGGAGGPAVAGGTGGSPVVEQPMSCSGTSMLKPGDTNGMLMVAGKARTFIVYVPTKYDGKTPAPLMLNFHPYAFGTAMGQRTGSGWAQIADQEGMIAVFLQGLNNQWDLGKLTRPGQDDDDRNFALAVVDYVKQNACINAKRVYATGYSMGGGLTHYLGCREANVFAAIGPSAFDLIKENLPCEPARPLTVIMFRGMGDAVVPFDGGVGMLTGPPASFPGAEMTFKMWADIDKCTDQPMPVDIGAPNCRRYSQCAAGTQVTLCINQGHTQGPAPAIWKAIKDFSIP